MNIYLIRVTWESNKDVNITRKCVAIANDFDEAVEMTRPTKEWLIENKLSHFVSLEFQEQSETQRGQNRHLGIALEGCKAEIVIESDYSCFIKAI